jgi:predicted anti-sigma-YlaC factor YlaD
MKLTTKILKKMVRAVQMTGPDEIGCDHCYDQLDRFAEMKLVGKSPEEAMPLVRDHLKRCKDCRQEYEALLEAMKHLKNTA